MNKSAFDVDEIMKEFEAAAKGMLERQFPRILENLFPVGTLLKLYEQTQEADILRSAVVFLHATVEDALRALGSFYLARGSEDVLNRVPLAGIYLNRPERFFLGKLAAHRGKTVDEVIALSVEQWLSHATFTAQQMGLAAEHLV